MIEIGPNLMRALIWMTFWISLVGIAGGKGFNIVKIINKDCKAKKEEIREEGAD